jgi:hypothetical protein
MFECIVLLPQALFTLVATFHCLSWCTTFSRLQRTLAVRAVSTRSNFDEYHDSSEVNKLSRQVILQKSSGSSFLEIFYPEHRLN